MARDGPGKSAGVDLSAIRAKLHHFDRKESWRWAAAVAVMLLLAVAVIVFSASAFMAREDHLYENRITQATRGLLVLVLLLSIYAAWQHWLISRLRRGGPEQQIPTAEYGIREADLHLLALTDPLTGLYNGQVFQDLLLSEIAAAELKGHDLTALIVDLQNFDEIEAEHGLPVSNRILVEFAVRLKKGIRNSDLAAKLQGARFLVLLPECSQDKVPGVLSRLQGLAVAADGLSIPVRFSAGWAEYMAGETSEEFLQKVETALLEDMTTGRTREEVRAFEAQVRQGEIMEALGRLAGGVAHDFNNILMVIRGYSDLLLTDGDQPRLLPERAREIQRAADRAARLTQQLLALSRSQMVQTTVLDLNRVVAEMDELLQRVVGEDIGLAAVLSDDLGTVRMDLGQLEQIILNLVVNARDAMPDGGRILIKTANTELDEAYARNHANVTQGSYVQLSVSDEGVGMEKEIQARIFEPFFTTKDSSSGRGLGLATIYGIVKQNSGSIWVYSEPRRGSTFKVYLPRAEDSETGAEPTDVSVPALSRGFETILLVEDDMSVRKLAREYLQGHGYEVLEAIEGGEATRISGQYNGTIHLLMTDVVMPGVSGPELRRLLAVQRPEMKVLFMSGYPDTSIGRQDGLDPSANYLQKPFTLNALGNKVREVLDSEKVTK